MPLWSPRLLSPGVFGGALTGFIQTDNPSAQDAQSTSVTFSAVNFGTAQADRRIVVVYSSTDAVATGMTAGGVTATLHVTESSVLSGLQIWSAAVPTGTSGDVVVTAGGNMRDCVMFAVAMYGMSGTPTSTAAENNGTEAPTTTSITVPSGGGAVYGSYRDTPGTDGAWNGATADFARTLVPVSGAGLAMAVVTASGAQTPEWVNSGAIDTHTVAVAWGP